jgi:hypothetical protein
MRIVCLFGIDLGPSESKQVNRSSGRFLAPRVNRQAEACEHRGDGDDDAPSLRRALPRGGMIGQRVLGLSARSQEH